MAIGATVRRFEIELSDMDRGVYETLSLKVAQHPSESGSYLITRLVAFSLEYEEGLSFTQGLSTSGVPPIEVRDLTGRLVAWIDVGTPEPNRLHKASKAADRTAVYCHKDPTAWLQRLASERVHDAQAISLYAVHPAVISTIANGLDRRNTWALSRMEGVVYLEANGDSHTLSVEHLEWPV